MLIDAVFALLVLLACIKGARKGFILALFSVLAFMAGLAAALKLSAVVANKLSSEPVLNGKWIPFLSFILVFIVVALLVNLAGRFLQQTAEVVMLGWVNKMAGICLFLLFYSLLYSILLFYSVQLHIIKKETTNVSMIYPVIQPLAPKVFDSIGIVIPFFKDLFSQLGHFFEGVSNKLQH